MRPERDSSRKVWVYAPRRAPPLSDVWRGGKARRAFISHWIGGTLQNAFDLAMFYAMKLLPADACSALGAKLGLFSLPRWHKGAVKKARVNLARLLPNAGDTERDALMVRNWENQGRLMTEFSVVNRMAKDGKRVTLHGEESIIDAARQGPLILMGLHTGNWELIWSIVHRLGIDAALNYAPPNSPARHWIARRVRQQAGISLLPPGKTAVRPALKRLQDSGTIIVFCDEGLRGKIRGPFLGRKPHADGNLALVARLARLTGARICPVYTLRTGGAQFSFHALPAISLPPEERSGARLMEDVVLLNSVIEPVIRDHLDQWYFLDNAL
ncbi:lipid A biosynthesis lauroyl acyltransferase [Pararhizobium sp. A13]|uniref:lysophospholipid acyltransferase family protein n=1 Tax=Pararhizobium sp. A13 TaxID=3133975 RepID=UPI00324AFB03